MKTNKWMPLLAIIFFSLSGCENSNQQSSVEEEVDSFLEITFSEPDTYFESALENYNQGDFEAVAEDLNSAIFFIQELNISEDTLNAPILNFAVGDIETILSDLSDSKVSENDLIRTFSSVNTSLASYHLAIVEGYYKNGGENKEGLERLHRALIRLDNAITYQGYELSEEEKEEIDSLKKTIAMANKTSPPLLDKVSSFFKRIEKKINSSN